MKVTPLAFLTIFAASSSAFGLNGGAKSVARATRSAVSFKKPALVQPVDIQGNRLSTSVSNQEEKQESRLFQWTIQIMTAATTDGTSLFFPSAHD
jgi:hypothetical protein